MAGGGGETVFRGGYHAQVWPQIMDPKLGLWVNSKSHPKQGFWQIFHTLKLGIFEFGKISYRNQGMSAKSYPNPMFTVGKNIP